MFLRLVESMFYNMFLKTPYICPVNNHKTENSYENNWNICTGPGSCCYQRR